MKALVAHPGSQHAHQLAWALEEAGYLGFYYSGVPVVSSLSPDNQLWRVVAKRLRSVPIPSNKRSHLVAFPLLRRLFGARPFSDIGNVKSWNLWLDHVHDFYVAKRIKAIKPDIVICYENSALNTFQSARNEGAICVLDAASIHHQSRAKWLDGVGHNNPAGIDARMQKEIELADAILTCSSFAAETYRLAGVPAEKVFSVPLGTNLPEIPLVDKREAGIFDFVFVGSVRRLKGVDLLLDAFEELKRDEVPVRLTMIGGIVEADLAVRVQEMANVTHRPFMQQSDLLSAIAQYDCLILPSRFDSFGMVVPEAMAVGVPAIVSDHVGAKCIIEQHPEAGWIVPCDKDALKTQILKLIANPQDIVSAARAALLAARDYSWGAYRRRVVKALEDIYFSVRANR